VSLLDLFRPKWKHSSEVVRLEAVTTIRDAALLARIASEDRDWRIGCKAVEGLNDPSRLASTRMSTSGGRSARTTPTSRRRTRRRGCCARLAAMKRGCATWATY